MKLNDLRVLLAERAVPDPERFARSIGQSMRAEGIPITDAAVLERCRLLSMKKHEWKAVEVNLSQLGTDAVWTCSSCGAEAGYESDGPAKDPYFCGEEGARGGSIPLPEDCEAASRMIAAYWARRHKWGTVFRDLGYMKADFWECTRCHVSGGPVIRDQARPLYKDIVYDGELISDDCFVAKKRIKELRIQGERVSTHQCAHGCVHIVATGKTDRHLELAGHLTLQNTGWAFVDACKQDYGIDRIVWWSFSDYHGREWHCEWERREDGWYRKALMGWEKDE